MTKGQIIKKLREEKDWTQEQLAKKIGTTKQTIYKYETGAVTNIPSDKIEAISRILNVSPAYIMGWSDTTDDLNLSDYGIRPIKKIKLPVLGEIACGKPIYADEDRDTYIDVDDSFGADFCLTAKGDSMINARIYDGDIVFIKQMDIVDDGDIAAVIIDDEATLKRFYYYRDEGKLILQAENPRYKPLVYTGEELNSIKVLGKAVAFQSRI